MSPRGPLSRRLRSIWVPIKYGSVVSLLVIILLRFVPPPGSALMVWRGAEALYVGDKVSADYRWIPYRDIPAHVVRAFVAAEDARFMRHHGLDLLELNKVLSRFSERPNRAYRGASTITMQTVKNMFLWPYRSYLRKGLEIIGAPAIDLIWGKRRVLEVYLNIIEFGPGIYGIEAASQHYYRKPAAKLSANDAASLAVILPNPLRYSPYRLSRGTQRSYYRILKEMRGVEIPL